MTSRIIYHDFTGNNPASTMTEPEPKVSLTATLLAKGRRLAAINNALNIACITLWGAAAGVSVFILTNLILG